MTIPFTPFSTTNLSLETVSHRVAWPTYDNAGRQSLADSFTAISETSGAVYSSSFVSCHHPEGKIWKSMFIALNKSGSTGISVTWWGKNLGVKGQAQAKIVSEKEWYGVVKSKAVGKDYKIEQYIGRYIPIDSNHQFVYDVLADEDAGRLPAMGFCPAQAASLIQMGTESKIGTLIGKAIAEDIFPTADFITFLEGKGLSIQSEMELAPKDRVSQDIVSAMTAMMFGAQKGKPPVAPKTPVPVIDREEVYGSGWGGFA
jgi:hypothetical protein